MDKKTYEELQCLLVVRCSDDVITSSQPYLEGEGENDIFG